MYGLVVGCSAVSHRRTSSSPSISRHLVNIQAFLPSSPTTPLLDPTRIESREATAFASLACIPALGTVTNVSMQGVLPVGVLEEVSSLSLPSSYHLLIKIHLS